MGGAVVWALAASAPGPASAQESRPDEASVEFSEGLGRARAGDYDGARLHFERAVALKRVPRALLNLALAEERTSRLLEALAHYKEVAADDSAIDEDRATANRHVGLLMAVTGHIDVRAPARTSILIDDGPVRGSAPFPEPLDVLPGRHVVTAQFAGGPRSFPVEAAAGQTARVEFRPEEAPPSSEAVPPLAQRIAPAPRVEVAAQPTEPVGRRPSAARIATVAVLGVAGLGAVGGGVYMAIASHNDASTAQNLRSNTPDTFCHTISSANAAPCSNLQRTIDDQNREAVWSTALYVTGGVLAAGALAAGLFWPRGAQPARTVWFAPDVGRTRAGLVVGASF